MRARLLAMLAALVANAAAARAETETFQAGSYIDIRQLSSGETAAGTITLTGTLSFPDTARGRYPAVVIVHTIGAYQEANEGWHAAEFRKAGFAP